MLNFSSNVKIYLAAGSTDMRKSFDALAAAARVVLEKDPYSGQVFAFCGRRRDLVKILYWDTTGFWLLAKRLARGCFAWPEKGDGRGCIELRPEQLAAVVGGLDLGRSAWKAWVPQPIRQAG